MSFVRRIKYFLVHGTGVTNKNAEALIREGKIFVNGECITENVLIDDEDEIKVEGRIVREKKEHVYIRFYKPAGYQSTLNKTIPDSIHCFFSEYDGLAIAGRLDKASEGLLLLSTNGKWIESIVNPDREIEKEYLVKLDREPDENFLLRFSSGVQLGDGLTKHCICKKRGEREITVVLTEGRNRQIRRMCHKLGFGVEKLKRVRINTIQLEGLAPGNFDFFKF